ncbi:MAG: recombination protein RecR [Oscillospiraceae bacterium]|jgi:recombination protein RecR|nr:recombination protein RecR [Oscillospiraceae bacterium]MBQ5340909.1 recombination protein RecR [Oscillospiraceae bacterium]MBQ5343422.1 recombination protein RecR [Oscillospiraceae bacterium]
MANTIPTLDKLIDCFAALPGVGRKSASRFAYHILDIPEEQALEFSQAIAEARQNVHQCPVCHNLTDTEECSICSDMNRDRSMICVVESPRDVSSIEKTREYRGLYHVLHGLISPLDGIGPEQLFIKQLITRAADDSVKEVIMATNPTVEGESTAMYISKLIKPLGVRVTRLATGVPVGGNLEYADEMTLFKALEGRSEI